MERAASRLAIRALPRRVVRATTATLLALAGLPAFAVPSVTATVPADAATAVVLPIDISITFSEPMDLMSLTTQGVAGPCTGTIQVSADSFTTCIGLGPVMVTMGMFVLTTPSPGLANGTNYRIRVTTGATAGGVPMAAPYIQGVGFTTFADGTCATGLTISQVYGGGGGASSTYQTDYVELHNPSRRQASLAGYALQYASETGSTWSKVDLPMVSIPPGGFYLLSLGTAGMSGMPVPNPDLTSTAFAMSAAGGKVALTSNTTVLSGTCPAGSQIVDFVGFGAPNCMEGMPAGATSATTALIRGRNGCLDANINITDFTVGSPNPRSLSSMQQDICACVANETNVAAELDYCNIQFPLSITVDPGQPVPNIYAQVYEPNFTELMGASPLITAEIGWGPTSANPQNQAGWQWFGASFNVQVMNNDEYMATFTAPMAAGAYRYGSRFTRDGINWTYCDLDGAGAGMGLAFDPAKLGPMTVTSGPPTAPQFTSPNNTTFAPGVAGSFFATASGNPTPGYAMSGTLPPGISFNGMSGELYGTAGAGSIGGWPLTFTAMNGVMPNATQPFALVIGTPPCSLDIDANGGVDALSDGLLLMRAMFGLTGTSVTNGALGGGAMRTTWSAIRAYLNGNCGGSFAP